MKSVLKLGQRILWLLLAQLPINLMAQPEIIPLFKETVPLNIACNQSESADSTKEGRPSHYRKVQSPRLCIWKSMKPGKKNKAVLVIPGGGYQFVSFENEGRRIAERFQNEGYDVFVLIYRLPSAICQKEPMWAPLTDAMEALKQVQEQGYETVAVLGFSAGGHLAATLCTLFDKNPYHSPVKPPDLACLVYPVISMEEWTHKGSRKNLLGKDTTKSNLELFSPHLQVSAKTPPILLVHSIDDQSVPYQNSELLFKAMLEKKVHASLYLYPTGGHGYGIGRITRPEAPDWIPSCLDFFEQYARFSLNTLKK